MSSIKTGEYPTLRPVQQAEGPCALVVRADALRSAFAARIDDLPAPRAVPALEAAVGLLQRALAGALPGATVQMTALALRRPDAKLKTSRGAELDELDIQATGQIEVPLPLELGYWPRARLQATLVGVCMTAVAEGRKLKPAVGASFSDPVAVVRDPEAHRAALLTRWLERTRQFTDLARAHGLTAQLHLHGCTPPGPIAQRALSLEEVELQLNLAGTLDPPPA